MRLQLLVISLLDISFVLHSIIIILYLVKNLINYLTQRDILSDNEINYLNISY